MTDSKSKWEYMTVKYASPEQLNELGEQGWELIGPAETGVWGPGSDGDGETYTTGTLKRLKESSSCQ